MAGLGQSWTDTETAVYGSYAHCEALLLKDASLR